jgi:3-phenylpropionate/cinnamic acid dioxygenase small subunit
MTAVPETDALRRLLDERDIQALAVRYAWCLDTREFDGLRSVFTADASARLGVECPDPDAIVARVTAALSPLDASHHLNGCHEVTFLDADHARHRCYFTAQHVRRHLEDGSNFIVAGTYHDEVVRTGEGWRIARRELTTVWTDGNPEVTRRAR